MTITNRDPRVDPRPGDVVRTEDGTERRVYRTDSHGTVWYSTQRGGWALEPEDWRRQHVTAEIVKVSP